MLEEKANLKSIVDLKTRLEDFGYSISEIDIVFRAIAANRVTWYDVTHESKDTIIAKTKNISLGTIMSKSD